VRSTDIVSLKIVALREGVLEKLFIVPGKRDRKVFCGVDKNLQVNYEPEKRDSLIKSLRIKIFLKNFIKGNRLPLDIDFR
jgi:hypothetical protein